MTDPTLPPPRTPGRYRVAVVCLGNICRSPMAEVVLTGMLEKAGLGDRVEVASAGTGDWHVGQPMDRRAAALLTTHGYDASRHRAQHVQRSWHEEYDLVLAMDATNLADLRELAGELAGDEGRLRLFRDFDPLVEGTDRDVPDPYYGGDEGFEEALALIRRTASELVRRLAVRLSAVSGSDGTLDG
jgi:protein-tyrosine phosphatase